MESGGYALRPYLRASVWDNLPPPVAADSNAAPKPMEHHDQVAGFILYRKTDMPGAAGSLTLRDVHDYATLFSDGAYLGGVTRATMPHYLADGLSVVANGEKLTIPRATSVLDVLVEGMGRVNYGDDLVDRKGITEAVYLDNAELRGWQTHSIPMNPAYVAALQPVCTDPRRPGLFFKASFMLDEVGDTFLDMRQWIKGVVWVNGRNIGRYWNVGPQFRLFCPAPWLRKGYNEVILFDLHQVDPMPIDLRSTPT